MPNATLFTPLHLGPYRLSHRVVMAPLTRMRAARPGNVPRPVRRTAYFSVTRWVKLIPSLITIDLKPSSLARSK